MKSRRAVVQAATKPFMHFGGCSGACASFGRDESLSKFPLMPALRARRRRRFTPVFFVVVCLILSAICLQLPGAEALADPYWCEAAAGAPPSKRTRLVHVVQECFTRLHVSAGGLNARETLQHTPGAKQKLCWRCIT